MTIARSATELTLHFDTAEAPAGIMKKRGEEGSFRTRRKKQLRVVNARRGAIATFPPPRHTGYIMNIHTGFITSLYFRSGWCRDEIMGSAVIHNNKEVAIIEQFAFTYLFYCVFIFTNVDWFNFIMSIAIITRTLFILFLGIFLRKFFEKNNIRAKIQQCFNLSCNVKILANLRYIK